ncbi:hypothetical protein VIGAN_01214500, partial [Vigna angularis var. angularis]
YPFMLPMCSPKVKGKLELLLQWNPCLLQGVTCACSNGIRIKGRHSLSSSNQDGVFPSNELNFFSQLNHRTSIPTPI